MSEVPRKYPKYSKEEFARRGEEIFEEKIEPQLTDDEDPRAYVLIDIETGNYEIDADQIKAGDRLDERHNNAQVWMRRVGSPVARHFGGRSLRWQTSDES